MRLSLFQHGAQMPFSMDCTSSLGPRTIQMQCCRRPTTKPGFTSFNAQFRYGARRQIHHQEGRPARGMNPFVLRRLVIWPFIGANVVVFFWWQQAKAEARQNRGSRKPTINDATFWRSSSSSRLQHMMDHYTLSPRNIQEGRPHTLFTSAISHEAVDHLLFNMISFNAFAGVAILGGPLPVSTLLALGVGSALASDLASLYDWNRKGQRNCQGLGASGVISGMATAVACSK